MKIGNRHTITGITSVTAVAARTHFAITTCRIPVITTIKAAVVDSDPTVAVRSTSSASFSAIATTGLAIRIFTAAAAGGSYIINSSTRVGLPILRAAGAATAATAAATAGTDWGSSTTEAAAAATAAAGHSNVITISIVCIATATLTATTTGCASIASRGIQLDGGGDHEIAHGVSGRASLTCRSTGSIFRIILCTVIIPIACTATTAATACTAACADASTGTAAAIAATATRTCIGPTTITSCCVFACAACFAISGSTSCGFYRALAH